MSIISAIGSLFTGGVVDTVVDLVKDFNDKKITKEELKFKMATLAETQAHETNLAQLAVNSKEAESHHWFVASWRPFIGWVCGLGFATNFIVAPFFTYFSSVFGVPIIFPQVELAAMMPVLLGMLGLGGLRTIEKAKGVARNNFKS